MIVRAVGKAETRPFTHSTEISREAAQRLLRSVPPASLQRRYLVHLFSSNHDLCNESRGQARSTKVKRTNRHFSAKMKAKKFASASTGQVRRLRTCTMMYAIQRVGRPTRVITRSTTLRLPRNNSSQEPWKRCAVLFLLEGGLREEAREGEGGGGLERGSERGGGRGGGLERGSERGGGGCEAED